MTPNELLRLKKWRLGAYLMLSSAAVPLSYAQDSETPDEGDVFVLSPFVVQTSEKDIGYFSENTLAGSRLNTKISDLAASITVVTKQQMEDTGSLDMNDVFRYEVNTEGAGTYTPSVQSLRNDGIVDTVAGYTHGGSGTPQTATTANRIRGLGSPDRTINYYLSVPIPFDAYNVQSLEINRGPNSMIFGIGSPAGIVNLTTAQASLSADTMRVGLRTDDRGSRRATFSFNQRITDNLAVYGAYLYNDTQYVRKPSYDRTNRWYGAVTYEPFETTKIRFNVENYVNHNRRPNSMTPRDTVTMWRNAGRPVYDASTLSVSLLDGGSQSVPWVMNSRSIYAQKTYDYLENMPDYDASLWNEKKDRYDGQVVFGTGIGWAPDSPMFVEGIQDVSNARPVMQIGDGKLQNWFMGYANTYRQEFGGAWWPGNDQIYSTTSEADDGTITTTPGNPAWDKAVQQHWWSSKLYGQPENIGSYKYAGVTDQSIYDWEKVNTSQMNFGKENAQTYNLELEQVVVEDLVHFNAGWFRQDYDSVTNYTIAQLNAATLFVDPNVTLPDGSPNPYLGLPYLEDWYPDQFYNSDLNDHYRAMVAITPDFTKEEGWMKWLGRHQIVAMTSRFENQHNFVRKRWYFTDSEGPALGTIRWVKDPSDDAFNHLNRSTHRQYYLAEPGDAQDGSVTRASGEWDNSSYTGDLTVYNFGNSQWEGVRMTQGFTEHDASTGASQRRIDNVKAGLTSYLWDDRIVSTIGWSRDSYKARVTSNGVLYDDDRNVKEESLATADIFKDGELNKDLIMNRYNLWDKLDGETTTLGVVFSPFKNWKSIEDAANNGAFWAQFLRGLGFHYNKSDNFNPPLEAQVDLFGNRLPKPSGEGKDYGVQFSLFDDKLYARITWFDATNENERANPGTAFSRLTGQLDKDLFRGWARTIALINRGFDPTSKEWGEDTNYNDNSSYWTPETIDTFEREEVAAIWGMQYDYYESLPGKAYATRSAEAEGVEAQIVFTPIDNWTMKFTMGKQETVYSNVLTEFDAWYASRSPAWFEANAKDYMDPQYQDKFLKYTTDGGADVDLSNFWEGYGWNKNIRLDNQYGYTNVKKYYDGNVYPQYRQSKDLDGLAAPGQRKLRWSFITNYAFKEGTLDGFNVGGSLRWADKAVIGYYGKVNPDDAENPDKIALSDVTRPIYDDDRYYTDVWVGYTDRIWDDKVRMKLQLNIANVFEDGRLQTVGVNYDGSPYAFRIVDPRQFIFQATFDF